jgi:pimeloyl-ACP methyl ester carboxylesterase
MEAMEEPPPLPWPWLSQLEFEFFVSEYSRSGFTGGLNWYRSMDLKWEQHKPYADYKSEVPAYFIGSEADVDLEGFHGDDPISLLRNQFPDLRKVSMIPKAGHMIHFEATEQLNEILIEYLSDIVAKE